MDLQNDIENTTEDQSKPTRSINNQGKGKEVQRRAPEQLGHGVRRPTNKHLSLPGKT